MNDENKPQSNFKGMSVFQPIIKEERELI